MEDFKTSLRVIFSARCFFAHFQSAAKLARN
jgi:hypothetical protein